MLWITWWSYVSGESFTRPTGIMDSSRRYSPPIQNRHHILQRDLLVSSLYVLITPSRRVVLPQPTIPLLQSLLLLGHSHLQNKNRKTTFSTSDGEQVSTCRIVHSSLPMLSVEELFEEELLTSSSLLLVYSLRSSSVSTSSLSSKRPSSPSFGRVGMISIPSHHISSLHSKEPSSSLLLSERILKLCD